MTRHWTATWNMKFGSKIWYDQRPMFAVIAGADDCHITSTDPVPQWQKCVDAVIDTMNTERCKCGVPSHVSHYCSALDHCWVGAK